MNTNRLDKFRRVAARRQPDITVILENVTDTHNIGAVIRSCDAVGVACIYVLQTEPHLQKEKIVIGKRTSMGTRKWVDVCYFTQPESCFSHVRARYARILGAGFAPGAGQLYDLDLTQPVALLFGNEHDGISDLTASMLDGHFTIPQFGMAESLNISVACAVTLFETLRQRKEAGYYTAPFRQTASEQAARLDDYLQRHENKRTGRMEVSRMDT
ncbi:MAG: hypothetical protein RLY31_1529 [Bacteroidota bacterium]|jgi:tRNA (guanosine-2'-O-)-methyltransferase